MEVYIHSCYNGTVKKALSELDLLKLRHRPRVSCSSGPFLWGDDMAREFSKQFYNSKEWEDVRSYILMRDAYLCRYCGAPATEVHHIIHLTPANIYDPSVSLNPCNLVSLCRDCHFAQHRGEHGRGRIKDEQYGYEFDENGMLQEIKPPGF